MKRIRLFAIFLALTLLLTACGTAGGKNDPSKQSTPPQESAQTDPHAEMPTQAVSSLDTTAQACPTAKERLPQTSKKARAML